MAWELVNSTAFTGPLAPVAAGAPLQGGWVDVSGGGFQILASGLLAQPSLISSPWLNARLMRSMAEAKLENRVVATIVASAPGAAHDFVFLRGDHATALFTGYIVGMSANYDAFILFPCVNGVVGALVQAFTLSGVSPGTAYKFDVEVLQTNSTTSTITARLYTTADVLVGSAGAIDDTTSALQNISGVGGFAINLGGDSGLVGVGRASELASYQQAANFSTSYSVNAPTAGAVGAASSNFTVTPSGSGPSANTVVTPSDNGGGGTFTPATVTFLAGSTTAKTFTYTPASAGAKTISYANDGGLANPANTTFTASVSNVVSVAQALFSPGNWKGDIGRGGTSYRRTWNPGAWFAYQWTASATPSASILIPTTATTVKIAIYLNGVLTDDVAATGNVALTGIIPSALNTLKVYLRDSTHDVRWNDGLNKLTIQGLLLDSGSVITAPPVARPWGILTGDSITEGEKANGGLSGINYGYAFGLDKALDQLGYDLSINACSRVGWLQTGDTSDDIPAYYKVIAGVYNDAQSRWNKIDQGISLLDSNGKISAYGNTDEQPAFIITNLLTNEVIMGAVVSDVQASVTQALVALRAAAPSAAIVVVVPTGLYDTSVALNAGSALYIAALKAGFNAYVAAHPNDGLVELIDLGLDFAKTLSRGIYTTDGVHPAAPGHSLLAAAFLPKLINLLDKRHNRWTY